MSYERKIMNVQPPYNGASARNLSRGYREGHRDARHACAEIAISADAEIERLRKREAHLVDMIERHERDAQRALRGIGSWSQYRDACERIQARAAGRGK